MAQHPFFSVIIPTLNEEKFLPKLLNALVKQTFRNFEVILVDGSSSDKTVEVFKKIMRFLPESQYFIVSRQNVAYQRNFGASKAKGKYLIFFDADVNISNTFLVEIHLAALKKRFPLATTWILPDSDNAAVKIVIHMINLVNELARGIGKPFVGGYNTIVKRDIFSKLGGFREDLLISEDHEFALKAEKADIPLTILQEPQVVFSLRRLRSEGKLTVFNKYAYAYLHMLLKGPITHGFFEYRMGGHVHKKVRKTKPDFYKINTYIKTIEQLEKKLVKLLST